jgi:hypothetical protein
MMCTCYLLHLLAFQVLEAGLCYNMSAACFSRVFFEMTQRNGKLPLIKFDNGDAYEGEWLNGNKHGHGIYTWADGER